MKIVCKYLGHCKYEDEINCSRCKHQYDSNYVSNFNYRTGRKFFEKPKVREQ